MTLKPNGWYCGDDFRPSLMDKMGGIIEEAVVDQIDTAICHIFEPPSCVAGTYFRLTERGIGVCVWDGDYDFVIPWGRISLVLSGETKAKRCENLEKLIEHIRGEANSYALDE